jgi:hypothetical protein
MRLWSVDTGLARAGLPFLSHMDGRRQGGSICVNRPLAKDAFWLFFRRVCRLPVCICCTRFAESSELLRYVVVASGGGTRFAALPPPRHGKSRRRPCLLDYLQQPALASLSLLISLSRSLSFRRDVASCRGTAGQGSRKVRRRRIHHPAARLRQKDGSRQSHPSR